MSYDVFVSNTFKILAAVVETISLPTNQVIKMH